MARDGYARMSVDAVAREAGVSKPTLYLRYPSKAALATAALAHAREQTAPRDTGDTRADLIATLRHFRTGVERPFGMALVGTALAEEHHTPELLAQFRENLVEPRRQMLRSVLERARARGELAPCGPGDSRERSRRLVLRELPGRQPRSARLARAGRRARPARTAI